MPFQFYADAALTTPLLHHLAAGQHLHALRAPAAIGQRGQGVGDDLGLG